MEKKYARAAHYALYPNILGLCGPRGRDKEKLYEYLTLKTKVGDREVRKLLEQFTAATAYMNLIAAANEILDWLDPRVVDAYWIGNDLLDRVWPKDLKILISRLANEGKIAAPAAEEAIARVHSDHRPHHSFHVFVIGGLSGQVERGSIGWELCRIGWGTVTRVKHDGNLMVLARSLLQRGGKILPELEGVERERLIRRDRELFPRVSAGDLVAFHWGRVVEIIDKDAAQRLDYWTERTLKNCSL
ncbi:MAG: DUF6390 family protein [Patescibacteria group bacterium]